MAEKKYVSDNAQLMDEWDWEENRILGYDPNKITYGSAIKVWWKCKEGHKWEASPNDRSRGHQCPMCAQIQRMITKRKNIVAHRGSLADHNPKLAQQWHPTRNLPLTPNGISVNSQERVWWLCEKGHEWIAPINSRNSGSGCPVCSGYKVVAGINDLATTRPDLARQWHPTKNGCLKPTDVLRGATRKVWWQCEQGHEWEARLVNRDNGTGCPVCSGKKVLVGYNDLATVIPSLAREWHPTKNDTLTPQNVTIGSNKRVWWQCNKGHEWETTVSHRSIGGRCPICFGESKTSFPEQAIFFYLRQVTEAYNRYMVAPHTEIDIFLPEHKIGIEYDGAFFHTGEASKQREQRKQAKLAEMGIILFRVREIREDDENVIYSKPGATDGELTQTIIELCFRISKVVQIPFEIDVDVARDRSNIYEQYIQSEKENSVAVINPELSAEWHPTKNGNLQPEYVSASSNRKVWWLCKEGHEWQAVINSRKDGVGCPYCAGKRAVIGESDLLTVNPFLATQWHATKNGKLTPQNVTAFSNKLVWWQCEKGHEWRTMVCNRSNGGNCPICSGRQVLADYNDLSTTMPSLAQEWHPTKNGELEPTCVTSGSDKKVWWLCKKGHEWEAVISSRKAGSGCPYCANQKVLVGYNDLATVNPQLASEWHPTKNGDKSPCAVTAGSNIKVWWQCKEGHEWQANIASRNSGRGCPYCAGQKVIVGYNDLATVNPALAAEWHPTQNGNFSPQNFLPNSNKKVWWICAKGHTWENTISSRNSGHQCPYCANQKVLIGYNDLATVNPQLASEWHPTKNGDKIPCTVMAGSNKKAWWLCKEGHEWQAVINSRNKGHGCFACSVRNRKPRSKKQ